jgi:Gnt-I system high-affinity gluconate transporter
MPLVLTFSCILLLVVLIAYFKFDTFLSFILVSITFGLLSGMEIEKVALSLKTGIGNTLGDLILIIGFGAMLGKLVAESGAAQRITDTLMEVFKGKALPWGLALAGFVIGIPLFYNAGFIIVIPLIFAIASFKKLPLLYIAIPMLSALSVAHGFLPPHPSPAAIASQLKADVGLTLLYGFIVAIPAIALAGPVWGSFFKNYETKTDTSLFSIERVPTESLPALWVSLLAALLPVLLLSVPSIFKGLNDYAVVRFLAQPYFGMLISVLFAIYFLGVRRGKTMPQVAKQLEEAIKSCSPILLIIAGAGTFKQVLSDSGTSKFIGELFSGVQVSPLILGWLVAAFLRVCVGSATVAGLTAVGILMPILSTSTIKPELMVLSIGAGSLFLSHINDSGFWFFKEYFNLSIKDTLKTWTIMESIVSVVGLIGVLILNVVL